MGGEKINLTDIPFTEIPLHIRGGSILPLRNSSAYTTTEVRKQPFNLLVAPSKDGKAKGELYLDDGVSIVQEATSEIEMSLEGKGVWVTCPEGGWKYDSEKKALMIQVGQKMDE